MKNYPKNNYSDRNSNKHKKNSDFKNFAKSENASGKNIPTKNNSFKKKQSNYKEESKYIKSKDKKDSYSFFSKRDALKNSKNEFSSKITSNNFQKITNKNNFDDWIWGKHSVYAALTSERAINRIWCTSEIFSSEKFYLVLKELKLKGVLVEEVSWNRLSQLTFGGTHQGVAMQLASSKTITLNKLIELSKTNTTNPIILALDGITDPHNLGAIIRSAEAFGCKGILLPQRRSAGLTGTVAKVAAGALEHIPVSRVVNLNRALEELKKNGFFIIGLSGDGNLSISNFNEKLPIVLIIGAEDKGISLLTQKKCDYLLRIPLRGKTSSLNASVAGAISLFHLTNNKISF